MKWILIILMLIVGPLSAQELADIDDVKIMGTASIEVDSIRASANLEKLWQSSYDFNYLDNIKAAGKESNEKKRKCLLAIQVGNATNLGIKAQYNFAQTSFFANMASYDYQKNQKKSLKLAMLNDFFGQMYTSYQYVDINTTNFDNELMQIRNNHGFSFMHTIVQSIENRLLVSFYNEENLNKPEETNKTAADFDFSTKAVLKIPATGYTGTAIIGIGNREVYLANEWGYETNWAQRMGIWLGADRHHLYPSVSLRLKPLAISNTLSFHFENTPSIISAGRGKLLTRIMGQSIAIPKGIAKDIIKAKWGIKYSGSYMLDIGLTHRYAIDVPLMVSADNPHYIESKLERHAVYAQLAWQYDLFDIKSKTEYVKINAYKLENRHLEYQPEFCQRLDMGYQNDKWTLRTDLNLRIVPVYTDVTKHKTWLIINANCDYKINAKLNATFDIDNLLHTRYQEYPGEKYRGIEVRTGLRYNF